MITIIQRVLDDVRAHAREEAPRECCGMLVGTGRQITASVRARNLEQGTTRFLIDPRDHIGAIRQSRARGLDVIGFYHSHPRSPPYPSETDVTEAGYAGAMHLIVGAVEDAAEARLFTIDGALVREVPFEAVADEPRVPGPSGGV